MLYVYYNLNISVLVIIIICIFSYPKKKGEKSAWRILLTLIVYRNKKQIQNDSFLRSKTDYCVWLLTNNCNCQKGVFLHRDWVIPVAALFIFVYILLFFFHLLRADIILEVDLNLTCLRIIDKRIHTWKKNPFNWFDYIYFLLFLEL